jgi:alpha-galactosidase
LTNDEVLAVNQDSLGKQATVVSGEKDGDSYSTGVLAKEMDDGSRAAGLFNTREAPADITIKWADIGLKDNCAVRDLWRQKDLGTFDGQFTTRVPSHGVVLIRIRPAQ